MKIENGKVILIAILSIIAIGVASAVIQIGGTGNENVIIPGDLTVGATALFVDNSTNRTGIGTTVPLSRLHVSGATGTANLTLGSSNIIAYGGDSLGTINFDSRMASYPGTWARIESTAACTGSCGATDVGSNIIFYTMNRTSGPLLERMRIDYLGYVGIGTTLPQYPLHIGKNASGSNISLYTTGGISATWFLDRTSAPKDSVNVLSELKAIRVDNDNCAGNKCEIDKSTLPAEMVKPYRYCLEYEQLPIYNDESKIVEYQNGDCISSEIKYARDLTYTVSHLLRENQEILKRVEYLESQVGDVDLLKAELCLMGRLAMCGG